MSEQNDLLDGISVDQPQELRPGIDGFDDRHNGKLIMSYKFFYRSKPPKELTYEDVREIVDRICNIRNAAQLSKSIYFGLELLCRILASKPETDPIIKAKNKKIREYIYTKLPKVSVSWGTQHLEMMGDFDLYGGVNGVLRKYYDLCLQNPDELPAEVTRKRTTENPAKLLADHRTKILRDQAEFINIALVQSYVTGKHVPIAAIYCILEEEADRSKNYMRVAKLRNLVHELSIVRKDDEIDVNSVIEAEREERAKTGKSLFDRYVPLTTRIDDSDIVPEGEDIKGVDYAKFKMENPQYFAKPQNGDTSLSSASAFVGPK